MRIPTPREIVRSIRPRRVRAARVAFRYLTNPRLQQFVSGLRKDGLTYLRTDALLDLYDAARVLERRQVAGIFIEAGCALGGSALVIAFAKRSSRPLFVYDVFETIPPPSPRDGKDAHMRYHDISNGQARGLAGKTYYGYQGSLLQTVQETFRAYGLETKKHNVHLVKGRYEDTLDVSERVAFAHIDCDWYDSVMTCLKQIVPMLVVGGVLVIDDYDAWSGCKRAVDDYFRDRRDQFEFRRRSRLHILRTRGGGSY